ncbi:hypothetical protein K469DRAFT_692727 [Zopfia rhizophila CBS 207.26]|uniref:DUF6594 domain-containing protein n=1 Tax=Zopfia rhizophila CBS 207.26 TaxID=1314779 RepID=A0A6A6DQB3_9PEZI|nr:hypothetical protein K469DRAFT_692727 [Zopfia rhizophila CBS 207.26]
MTGHGLIMGEKVDRQPERQGSGDAIIDIDSPTKRAVNSPSDLTLVASSQAAQIQKRDKERARKIDTKSLEEYPLGYPRLAAFESSESSFSLYRGFSYLHSRVILELQDELRCLEANLQDLDEMDDINGQGRRLMSRAMDLRQAKKEGVTSKRAQLIGAIREKLVLYDEILVKARELNGFQRPSKRDYRSVRTWFVNEKPLSDVKEESFIKQREDIISLRLGREWGGFDGLIETILQKMRCPMIQRIFTTQELRDKTNDKSIHYYSPSRVENLVGLIITLIIFILLVVPVVVMYKLTKIGERNSTFDAVGILVIFTLLFSAAMAFLTKARRHELFAASAAYCAVLVVFISNFNDLKGKSKG